MSYPIISSIKDRPVHDQVYTYEAIAASKYIGRLCAEANRDFVKCKVTCQGNPVTCLDQADAVTICVNDTVGKLKKDYPKEFTALAVCIDAHDYRMHECSTEANALRDCWNRDHYGKTTK